MKKQPKKSLTREEKIKRLQELSVPWEGREMFLKRVRRRKKYRKLIRLRDKIHLKWLIFKDFIKNQML